MELLISGWSLARIISACNKINIIDYRIFNRCHAHLLSYTDAIMSLMVPYDEARCAHRHFVSRTPVFQLLPVVGVTGGWG